ncbi:MAG: S41 family peptidase [Acidobacteria bacterium]|nr:S41 family peptidase [Acidobacteriota bacterium]
MKRRLVIIIIAVLGLTGVVSGLIMAQAVTWQALTPTRLEQEFQEAWTLAKTHYAGEADIVRVTESAIQGMLSALDPHSNYLDPKDYAELRREQESRFYGIGVTINRRNGRVHILSVIPDTPAEHAGLQYGDAILAVDDTSVVDWSTAQVARLVRGERNTLVKLTVERVGEAKPLTVRIKREPVPLPSISNAFMLRSGVAYVGLTRGFQGTTIDELNEAIRQLKAQGTRGMVLDLRFNPGGLLTQAVQVASRFLQPGEVVVSVRGRKSTRPPYRSMSADQDGFPLIVLINQASASASEIVAGALQDHDRALIVGEPSFGKGLVQTVYPIMRGFGGAVTLSTARYYTPSGRLIQRDYSRLSNYDYYLARGNNQHGNAATTDGGRPVYGGGGIEPDVLIPMPNDPMRGRIFGAAFEFTRHLVAGQIKGLAYFRVERPQPVRSDAEVKVDINEAVLKAFRQFVEKRREFQLSPADADAHLEYTRQRIQEEVATARYGVEAGNRIALEHDEQLQRAVQALPQAKELVENLRQAKERRF